MTSLSIFKCSNLLFYPFTLLDRLRRKDQSLLVLIIIILLVIKEGKHLSFVL